MTGTFYAGEVDIPCGGWCNGADFTKISKFPEILGELSMRKQCVPGSFFSAHAQEPGNKATLACDTQNLLCVANGYQTYMTPLFYFVVLASLCSFLLPFLFSFFFFLPPPTCLPLLHILSFFDMTASRCTVEH